MDYTGTRWRASTLFARTLFVRRKNPTQAAPLSVKDLLRENADLRHELARLEVYRALAYRDELTGLWNRRYFTERLTEELSRSRRQPKRHFSVMMIDVNDLKSINDSYGHPEGDLVLRWVAEFLERSLRTHDVLCRVDGDEFAVILPEIGAVGSAPLLTRLRMALSQAPTDAPFSIGLSFGIADYPDDGITCDELVRVADDEMRLDKRRQKNAAEGSLLAGPLAAAART
jgi:diguanylate cyclase (GGDEF)-like protein